ncbi:MAG: hypothetical protein NWS40_08800 [Crocinitomicaceae bacterium]|nr:hypothetical protein [Crocinitomicaceae bacterium]MDP5010621.1 hypothetical protein [Crocinitomicaceae bacterium]MDP5098612.1 hypothetical protein [Crocinitomicaceae bacterium]
MISRLFLFVFVAVLASCSTGVQLKPVDLGTLFHDGNSKVWLVDKVIIDRQNFAPKQAADKDAFIFYSTSKCSFQPLKTMGDFSSKNGEFSVYSNEKLLTVYFKKEVWEFKLASLSDNKIVLKPTKKSDLKYTLVLIPLPEL